MSERNITNAADDGNDVQTVDEVDTNDACVPIVNALLTFIISILHNATDPKIIDLIGRYFDSTQVKDAKCVLCDAGRVQFKNRQDSENRTEKMAHARDIVDILRNLDRASSIPLFVVDGVGLASLPRVNAEDISYVSVAEKMADICAKVDLLNNAVAMNTARSIDNENKIKQSCADAFNASQSTDFPPLRPMSTSRMPASHSMPPPQHGSLPPRVRQPAMQHKAVTTSGDPPVSECRMPPLISTPTVVPNRPVVSPTSKSATAGNTKMIHEDAITSRSGAAAVPEGSGYADVTKMTPSHVGESHSSRPLHYQNKHTLEHSASRSSINSGTSGGNWQFQSQHVRKFERRNKRKRIQGTASGSNVIGAPSPTRHMFIYRVSSTTGDEDLRQWIANKNIDIIDFQRVSHDESKFKSYKLTVTVHDFISLYKPEMWPERVCIGKYVPPRKTDSK